MKSTQRPQRRRAARTGPSISLFPFLAVLICTMGALVPLLLAMTRTARLQAEAAAVAKATEEAAKHSTELQTAREDVLWRIEQLKNSRKATESQLAEARLELGHLEDHSRRLRGKLEQYKNTVADLENIEKADRQKQGQSEAELQRLRERLAAAKEQLGETRKAAAGRNRSYAVVPYEGPNQTRRRPIYLECRADAVVLQPEGIRLTDADFDGPMGPGNPLAAALRAAREHLLAGQGFDPQAGEPYPLLLVRPEGIGAYYAAREAMKSWGCDFGYELVGDDWTLAYQQADPRLAEVVRQAIDSARIQQARLIAAAPRQYATRKKPVYVASPNGGFVRADGGPRGDDDEGYRPATPAGSVGRNSGGGQGGREPAVYGREGHGGGSGGQGTGTGDGAGNEYNPYVVANERQGNAVRGGGNGVPSGTSSGGGSYGDGPGLASAGWSGSSGNGNTAGQANSGTQEASSGTREAGGMGDGTGGAGGGQLGGMGGGTVANPYVTTSDHSGTAVVGSGGIPSGASSGGGQYGDGPALTSASWSGNAGNGSTAGQASSGTQQYGGGGGGGSGTGGGTGSGVGDGSYNPVRGGASNAVSNPYVTMPDGSRAAASGGGTCPGTSSGGAARGGASTANYGRSNGSRNDGPAVERPEGYVVGQPGREQAAPPVGNPQPAGEMSQGRVMRPGEWEPRPEPPPKPREEKQEEDRFGRKKPHEPPRSLAERRGEDWGLRDAARGSVGVTRPIRVECHADRLVVLSDRNPADNKVVPLGQNTASSIDTFISAIWGHIEGWGIAGRGMYWRPVLQVSVAPGAEDRFSDLAALLDGSGLTVKRR